MQPDQQISDAVLLVPSRLGAPRANLLVDGDRDWEVQANALRA